MDYVKEYLGIGSVNYVAFSWGDDLVLDILGFIAGDAHKRNVQIEQVV